MDQLKLSIVIPAYNEAKNIKLTVDEITPLLAEEKIPYELVIVNDNSVDETPQVVESMIKDNPAIRLVNRTAPGGFGRAIRSGLANTKGDVIVIVMADQSDDPKDIVRYYRKIEEGYDCVFGSRFLKGSVVKDYPPFKLFVNRIVNKMIQLLFLTRFNDLTNAFKAFRSHVIEDCGPYFSSHFNVTIELSLSALIQKYHIAQIPINWYGRKWGSSNLHLREMGRRYLVVLLSLFFKKLLISDDMIEERIAKQVKTGNHVNALKLKVDQLEERVQQLESRPPNYLPHKEDDNVTQPLNPH